MKAALRIRVIYGALDRMQRRQTLRWFDEGMRRQEGTRDALAAYADARLVQLLAHALRDVPFYEKRLGALSSSPELLAGRLFPSIPPLEKAEIAAEGDALLARGRSKDEPGIIAITSGGTTGVPARIWLDGPARDAHAAAALRSFLWWGADPTRRHAMLWGPPPGENTYASLGGRIKGRLLGRELISTWDLDDARARACWERILRLRLNFVVGYSSALVRVAAAARGDETARVAHGVVPAAEPIFDFQRANLERRFGAPVRERYGCNEFSLIAHQCTSGSMHVATDRVRLELIGPDGREVGPGEVGEVLVTDLDNALMPLIRYRIGDLAEWGPDCHCGLPFPVLARIHGRRRDLLRDRDGRWISPHAFAAALIGTPVRAFQLATDATGVVAEVRLDSEAFPPGELVARWQALGARPDLRVHFVRELVRSRSGKHLPVLGPGEWSELH